METLGKIFGTPARVKVMKLFLSNETVAFDSEDISKRTKVTPSTITKELNLLNKVGFIKKTSFYKEIQQKNKKTKNKPAEIKIIKKKFNGWVLDDKFTYITPLQNLLVNISSLASPESLKKISKSGKIKLVLVAGVFIQNPDSRVDMLVVGDNIKNSSLKSAIELLESEIGKEVQYVVFDTTEFQYRMNIYDKLVRDILDYPHHKLINRLGI